MAQRVRIELTDDLDQSPADETVTFALDGVTYEIDLTTANAAKLREALAPYVGVGRRTGGRKTSGQASRGRRRRSGGSSANAVREWARAQGMEISERGRVRDEVKAAYEAAHS